MSILQEYEQIRHELGEEVYAAIERYLALHPELFLSDIYYKEEEFEKFEAWYGKPVHEKPSDTADFDRQPMDSSELSARLNASGKSRADLCRTGRVLYTIEWKGGSMNDTLAAHLMAKGFQYLHTFNGDIWFLNEKGALCSAEFEVKDNVIRAYELA